MITFKNNVSYDDKVNKEDKEEETKREKNTKDGEKEYTVYEREIQID